MKRLFLFSLVLMINQTISVAQTPIVFNYQAVVRDTSNQPYKNQPVHLEVQVRDGNDQEVFSDEHDVITTTLGVFNVQVGSGENKTGDLSVIDWENGGPFFLHVTITVGATDPKKFELTPTQLVFVPNSLYAIQASKSRTLDGFSAGPGIEVAANKVSNTGILKVEKGAGIEIQGTNMPVIINTGVLEVIAGTGISLQGTPAKPEIINEGVLKTDLAGGQLTGEFENLSIADLNAKNGDVLQYHQPSQKWIPGSSVPVGSIMPFAGPESKIPAGWLLCDGRGVDQSGVYAALFDVIGTLWGTGNGSSTFNIPDFQGLFMRGVSYTDTDNYDADKANRTPKGSGGANEVGSYQPDEFAAHNHTINSMNGTSGIGSGIYPLTGSSLGGANPQPVSSSGGSGETRPKNVYVNYIIKY